MNLQNMMNQITTLGAQVKAQAERVMDMSATATGKELKAEQDKLNDLKDRLAAVQDSYNTLKGAQENELRPAQKEESRSVREMRASNEYARAFAFALRNGLNPRTAGRFEETKVLMDALTETTGSPAGTDGGFLVPIDIDNRIRELKRELNPLATLFTQETVNTLSGWRVIDTAPSTGMSSVNEMGSISASGDQPAFAKVTYTLTKYGLIVPVSNELLSDEVANLMEYLARWFAKKQVLTENGLLITALKTLTASALGSATVDAIAALKGVLNKSLDPMIAANAVIITNQDGFDALDQLVDEMGRGLLQPDPTNSTVMRVLGHQIVKVSNAQLPDTEVSTKDNAEFFIGDMREFATLFSRQPLEVASTDIGGSAWRSDSTEVRGISRMCVSKFDTAAAVRRQLEL